MTKIDRQRLGFVAAGFLSEMRKRFVSMHPDRECPIRAFSDYSPADQSALMAGLQKALEFAQPESDKLFDAWAERQKEPVDA